MPKKTASEPVQLKSGPTRNSIPATTEGRQRIIITNVMPQVDGGKYPARTAIGEPVVISADVFADGHDVLKAVVLMKHRNVRKWQEKPMEFVLNDRWQLLFKPEETGFYTFRILAWIDHFTTWQQGLLKKFKAGVVVETDLLVGIEMLEEMANQASAIIKKKLRSWSNDIQRADEIAERVRLSSDNDLSELVAQARVRPFAVTTGVDFTVEVEDRKAVFSTWYELFPRSASETPGQHGTFEDVEKLLPRIAEMGFDTLYFPPIHPIGEKNRKGKNNALTAEPNDPGSPWAIGNKTGGHKDIHPGLGTLDDFKVLISSAKKMDIEIAMDIAFQCAPDHPYVQEHPQWFRWRPDGTVQYAENPPKKYEDILPINFETQDWKNLWEELKSVVAYWIEQGIRIFRVDNPHTKAFPFWEWMIGEIRSKNPEVIFLAEAFTRPRLMEHLAKIGFTQSYTYFTWRIHKYELEKYMTELTQTELKHYFKPNFWPNTPDILPPHLSSGGENAHVIRVILAATLSSNYGIYGPVYEFGINHPHPQKEEYYENEKYEIKHWDWNRKTRIRDVITRLNKIRKENRALQSTNNIIIAETSNEQVMAYVKQDVENENTLLVVINLDPHHPHSAFVKVPVEQIGLKWQQPYYVNDLLSEGQYRWQDESNFVILNPNDMPAHIFVIEQQS